jgi:hypothetical protein
MESKTASDFIACVPVALPPEKWLQAAENAARINPRNLPEGLTPADVVGAPGEKAALDLDRYWGSQGVSLTVGFLDSPSSDLRRRILSHMNAWSKTANVVFVESSVDPQVRISQSLVGYWSYLGTDILSIAADKPTMNLQGFTMDTRDSEFYRVVRHETGHTLGFPHEHLRRGIIQRLDREKVIASYMASQGWTRAKVIAQILTPLEESRIFATPVTDPNSIMCYQIDGSLTLDGQPVEGGTDIDESDYQFVAQCYPKVD